MIHNQKLYHKPEQIQFEKEAHHSSLKILHYISNNEYDGPAVLCDDLNGTKKLFSMQCQWDHVGTNFIVFPISLKILPEENPNEE